MVDSSEGESIYSQALDSPLFVPFDTSGDSLQPNIADNSSNNELSGIASGVSSIVSLIGTIVPEVGGVIAGAIEAVVVEHPVAVIKRYLDHAKKHAQWFQGLEKGEWTWITENVIGQLFISYLSDGLGVDVSQFDSEAMSGVDTVNSMVGFALASNVIAAGIDAVGKATLANRWPEELVETVKEIPTELGLTWAMGMQIDKAFETAVGKSIEEAINKQKRGNRIEWTVLRQLLKQHIFDEYSLDANGNLQPTDAKGGTGAGNAVFRDLLENQGFPDEQIDWIMKLADQPLAVGDIQQLYLRGEITDTEAKKKLQTLGFASDDVDKLYTLYVDKAMTQAGGQVVAVARALYRANIIDADAYKGYLNKYNFPIKEIDADIEAISLEHTNGRIADTVARIKSQWQHDNNDDSTAQTQLQLIGYTPTFATETIASWKYAPLPRAHSLTEAQVLKYQVSGLIDPTASLNRLLAMGVNPNDAAFLVANPTAKNGVSPHKLTAGFVTQAYLDHAIEHADLHDAYIKAGITEDDVSKYIAIAEYKYAHHKPGDAPHLDLNESQVRQAYHYNIWDRPTAHDALVKIGYSSDLATVLLEITAKGKFTTGGPGPAFKNFSEAADFLEQLGFILIPPPDPRIAEAEALVEAQGYIVEQPANFSGRVPPPPPASGGPTVPPQSPVGGPTPPLTQ